MSKKYIVMCDDTEIADFDEIELAANYIEERKKTDTEGRYGIGIHASARPSLQTPPETPSDGA